MRIRSPLFWCLVLVFGMAVAESSGQTPSAMAEVPCTWQRWEHALTSTRQYSNPYADETCAQWNPAYWQSFDRKIRLANEKGLVVLLVGLMEPVDRYPESSRACLFARNIVARLYGATS